MSAGANVLAMPGVPDSRTVASLSVEPAASACILPTPHINVTSEFDPTTIRHDYTISDIAAFAHQQHRGTGRALLGFYASEFSYTIVLVLNNRDPGCLAQIEAIVTLRLQHRLIEIAHEAAANSCLYAAALQHYRRMAEADEQTIERFRISVAATLIRAGPALKQNGKDPDARVRKQIRAVVDGAVGALDEARHTAEQAVNSSGDLRQLALACST